MKRKLRAGEIVGYQCGRIWYIPRDEIAAYRDRQLAKSRWRAQVTATEDKVRWQYERLRAVSMERRWALRHCPECATLVFTQKAQRFLGEEHGWQWGRKGECSACGHDYWENFGFDDEERKGDYVDAYTLLRETETLSPNDAEELKYRQACYEVAKRFVEESWLQGES